jgi:hypothetical protein
MFETSFCTPLLKPSMPCDKWCRSRREKNPVLRQGGKEKAIAVATVTGRRQHLDDLLSAKVESTPTLRKPEFPSHSLGISNEEAWGWVPSKGDSWQDIGRRS